MSKILQWLGLSNDPVEDEEIITTALQAPDPIPVPSTPITVDVTDEQRAACLALSMTPEQVTTQALDQAIVNVTQARLNTILFRLQSLTPSQRSQAVTQFEAVLNNIQP